MEKRKTKNKNYSEKIICGLCNQVEILQLMVSLVLSEEKLAKDIRLVREAFLNKIRDFVVRRMNKKAHEYTRDQYENAITHSG